MKHSKWILFFAVTLLLLVFVSCSKDDGFVNTEPAISDRVFSVIENSENGTVIGLLEASDIDDGQSLTFSIISGNRNNAFVLSTGGTLTVGNSSELNFEEVSVFSLTVEVSDDQGGTANATVSIQVIDINEIHIVEDQSFSTIENAVNGTVLGTIVIDDPEDLTSFEFSIISGNNQSLFLLGNDGFLVFVGSICDLDFEIKNVYNLEIQVSDSDFSVTSSIIISITDDELDDGLVAYYPLEASAEDCYGNDGTVIGASLTEDRFGNANSAYSFDGIDDQITFDHISGLQNLSTTISFWVYFNEMNSAILGTDIIDDSQSGIWFSVGQATNTMNRIAVSYGNGGSPRPESRKTVISDIELVTDTWYHIVGTVSAEALSIYVNANLENGDFTGSANSFFMSQNGGSFGRTWDPDAFFSGKLDDIRIYNRILTEDEIASLFK